jgi:hypothetical protein
MCLGSARPAWLRSARSERVTSRSVGDLHRSATAEPSEPRVREYRRRSAVDDPALSLARHEEEPCALGIERDVRQFDKGLHDFPRTFPEPSIEKGD